MPVFDFETASCYVVLPGFKLATGFLPLPPQCGDYRRATPHPPKPRSLVPKNSGQLGAGLSGYHSKVQIQ